MQILTLLEDYLIFMLCYFYFLKFSPNLSLDLMVELTRRERFFLVCPGPSKQLCEQQVLDLVGSQLLDMIQGSA